MPGGTSHHTFPSRRKKVIAHIWHTGCPARIHVNRRNVGFIRQTLSRDPVSTSLVSGFPSQFSDLVRRSSRAFFLSQSSLERRIRTASSSFFHVPSFMLFPGAIEVGTMISDEHWRNGMSLRFSVGHRKKREQRAEINAPLRSSRCSSFLGLISHWKLILLSPIEPNRA